MRVMARRLLLIGLVVLFACRERLPADGGDAGTTLGTPPAPPWTGCPCAQKPPNTPACGGSTCGNGTLETCYTQSPMGCRCVMILMEVCDGNVTCDDLGFYGGSVECGPSCLSTSTAGCEACAPANLACVKLATGTPRALAASGTHLAVATTTGIEIFDGLTHVLKVYVTDARALVGVPNGWLVVSQTGPSLFTLDTSGMGGAATTIASADTAMTYGPGGRALLTWRELVNAQSRGVFAIAATDGSLVVPRTELFGVGERRPAAATDGTSFFVGALGQLARIAPDGTSTIVTGFPVQQPTSNDDVALSWAGTTGWYVSWNNQLVTFTAQRFDAAGAKIGVPVTVNFGTVPPFDFLADGDDLLVLRRVDRRYVIVRVTSAGAVSPGVEVGAIHGSVSFGRFARLGSDVLVAWARQSYLQLAHSAP